MIKKNKLVCGVGTNDYGEPVYIDGRHIPSYECWHHILQRCYDPKCQTRQSTYIGCCVCDEWKYFSNFKEFYDENYKPGFQLDKDILKIGNKIYCPEFCRFVPPYINLLLIDCGAVRGDLPLGVTASKPNIKTGKINTTYTGECNNGYGRLITKTFKTIEEAQHFYSITKKRIVKEQAIRAFLDNAIKTDVYLALVRREW